MRSSTLRVTAFDGMPPFARGQVPVLRMRWARRDQMRPFEEDAARYEAV